MKRFLILAISLAVLMSCEKVSGEKKQQDETPEIEKNKDFVININETDIALVKETKADIDRKDIENLASSIADTLSGEFYVHTVIGIGTTVNNLKNLAKSFKEAQTALEVGKVFDTEKTIISYDNLGGTMGNTILVTAYGTAIKYEENED